MEMQKILASYQIQNFKLYFLHFNYFCKHKW